MQVMCDKCQRDYDVSCSFMTGRLWRLTCPHCGAATWVSAPVSDGSAITAPTGAARKSPSFLKRVRG